VRVSATTSSPRHTAADTVVVGVFEGEDVAHDVSDGALQRLLDSGEAKRRFKATALAHADGKRWIVAGLGDRASFDAERARVAAATVLARARELGAQILCWELPHHVEDAIAGGLVEGTVLGAYRFAHFKSAAPDEGDGVRELLVSAHHDVGAPVERAATVAGSVNRARDLQNTPANHMTPTHLARRAQQVAGMSETLTAEVEHREGIVARGMGAFAAVAQGSYEEPALITLRYAGSGRQGGAPALGLVGKAVTFDTGGISIKPAAKMHEMKFDMSGGAAVIEAMGAIAALELPIDVVAVVGATENMPSGRSMKPGDIVTAMTGTTIEVNNTDAEGRLVLADCLARAVELGAERIVDLATLTGAIVIALGNTYSGLVSNDDDWAAEVEAAGSASGDIVWRLPLHDDYAELVKGQYADLTNAPEGRKAGSITAAAFLRRFVGDAPWAHVDIAGTGNDTGRAYAPKGGTGVGVRLIVELATRVAADAGARGAAA
jgi:leucyl aminopeptidase